MNSSTDIIFILAIIFVISIIIFINLKKTIKVNFDKIKANNLSQSKNKQENFVVSAPIEKQEIFASPNPKNKNNNDKMEKISLEDYNKKLIEKIEADDYNNIIENDKIPYNIGACDSMAGLHNIGEINLNNNDNNNIDFTNYDYDIKPSGYIFEEN